MNFMTNLLLSHLQTIQLKKETNQFTAVLHILNKGMRLNPLKAHYNK